ncbi:MAG TPA: hypothetical protein PLP01_01185 [Phycisphaerae bacterium]|nr:hypothetical protein [Phycisphaerae bacterium]HOI53839.1 hypothetical protein [Phycisphaerae bacterium]
MGDPALDQGRPTKPGESAPRAAPLWARRGCQVNFLLAILVVASPLVVRHVLIRRAENHMAEVEAGLSFKLLPPEAINDWIGPMPEEDQNAAALYAEISGKMEMLLAEEIEPGEPRTVSERLDELLAAWGIQKADDEEAELPPRDVAEARRFLERFKDIQALRDQAVERPSCRTRQNWADPFEAVLPCLSHVIILSRLTAMEIAVDTQAGDQAAAYRKVMTLLRMAGHMEQEPTQIHVLVGRVARDEACRRLPDLLAAGPPDEDFRREFRTLAATERARMLPRAAQLETMAMDVVLRDCVAGRVSATVLGGEPSPADRAAGWLFRWRVLNDRAAYLRLMDRQIEISSLPPGDMAAEFAKFEAVELADVKDFPMTSLILSGLCPSAGRLDIGGAEDRLAMLAVDLSRHKAAHGRYPEALDEMRLSEGLSADPFGGKPFGYRRTDDGFVLWSVGPDAKDDGGRTPGELGFKADEYKSGGDIVFRVPSLSKGAAGP